MGHNPRLHHMRVTNHAHCMRHGVAHGRGQWQVYVWSAMTQGHHFVTDCAPLCCLAPL